MTGSGKILIVEDELVLAYAMEEMLRSLGHHEILIEPNYDHALKLLQEDAIQIALLDINLGLGDEGIRLAQVADQKGIPFIYISSYTDKDTLDRALATKPGAYLIKPVSEGNLYTTVQIVLDRNKTTSVPIIEFKDGNELIRLALNKVIYLKAENIYVNVVTKEKIYLYRGSLTSMVEKVPQGKLIQTHRSFVVNPQHIERVSATYVIVDGNEIPVSRNFKNQFTKQ